MKKNRKNIIALFILMSTLAKGLPVVDVAAVASMAAQNVIATSTLISTAAEVTESIQFTANQALQIKNDLLNLVAMGQDLADGNIFAIKDMLNNIVSNQERAQSIMYDQNSITTQYRALYKKDPAAFTNATGYSERSLEAMQDQVHDALEETNKIIYDTMTTSGFSAKLKDDSGNIEKLLQEAKTAQGALQVNQVASNIIGQQSKAMLEVRTLLETQAKMEASIEANKLTVKNANERINAEGLRKLQSDSNVFRKESGNFDADIVIQE